MEPRSVDKATKPEVTGVEGTRTDTEVARRLGTSSSWVHDHRLKLDDAERKPEVGLGRRAFMRITAAIGSHPVACARPLNDWANKGRIHLRRPTCPLFSLATRRRTIHSGWRVIRSELTNSLLSIVVL